MQEKDNIVLEVKDLKVYFYLSEGTLRAVDGVDLIIKKGKILGIVGESGCGKTVTAQAILRIVPSPGKVMGKILFYNGGNNKVPLDLVKLNQYGKTIRQMRGGEIAMIFQEPMKAFSPIHTIGNQIIEGILLHVTDDPKEAKKLAIDMLKKVGIPNAEQRFNEYPHQLSGGLRQRAMVAMAISCNPAILIADEPTTALDVTVQAQVLDLINDLKVKINSSIIYITHDLGVIAEMADDVAVMYLGKVVEYTDVDTLFHGALHPYTIALLNSITAVTKKSKTKLESIEGTVPFPINLPKGCVFYSRCKRARDGLCNIEDIPMVEEQKDHFVRCLLVDRKNQRKVISLDE